MSISFSKLGSLGRTGNVLFQIASTLGIAERNNTIAFFPSWKHEDKFNIPLDHGPMETMPYKEQQYHYEPVDIDNVDLQGYWQSEKYFGTRKLQFTHAFKSQQLQHPAFTQPTIGIHIRRGDYVGHTEYYQLPIHWYVSALLSIPNWEVYNVVIVSDDIPYCRVHFECLPNVFFMQGSDVEDLCSYSLCDWQIMSNSSFSWWGGYLSALQQCIHPGVLFRGNYAATKDIKDFWPDRWTRHPIQKLNLSDVTFTIPVMYDHPDRKQNLDLSLCMLQQAYEAKFIVMEQGGDRFSYMRDYAIYILSESKVFHRTNMLNQMAEAADTDIIVNWDADVFIPPMQTIQSVLAIRAGAPVSYPYDGRFARLDRSMFKTIEKFLDIGLSAGHPFKGKNGRPMPETSVGGAVLWNKEAFIDAGMENEHMISFGPEDVERHERMKMLGLDIHRAGGCLYHMNHYVGPNSSKHNPHFNANHAELNKMRKMNAQQMREYIDSWPWRHKYTGAYYKRIQEGAIRSAEATYKAIGFQGGSVIDIGCGVGEWALYNPKYEGVDWSVPLDKLLFPIDNYFNADLNGVDIDGLEWFGDDAEWPGSVGSKFDLAICLEVGEHLNPDRADFLVSLLCNSSDTVLFSAAIPFQGGTGHINEQWQSWWAEKFYDNGFGAAMCYPVKDNPEVELWYRNNMVLYRRGDTGKVYDFILPEYYEQIVQNFKNIAEAK